MSSTSSSALRPRHVAVTGVTGFTAGHIVEELLKFRNAEYYFVVHCTVRDVKNTQRYDFLNKLAEQYYIDDAPIAEDRANRLRFFQADLTVPGSFDEAFTGCEAVIHVAAVTELRITTCPFKDIINGGVDGTREVARACERCPTVKRIVLTSSGSLVDQIEADREPKYRGKPFHEDEEKLDLRPSYVPYVVEKYLSEKLIPTEFTRGPVISLLPTLIIGPQQNSEIRSSMNLMRYLANREAPFCVGFYASWIDVRDVAAAHRVALDVEYPEEVKKTGIRLRRYFVSSEEVVSTEDIGKSMNRQFPNMNAPQWTVPNWMLWFFSFFDDRLTEYFRNFLSVPRERASQERMTNELKFVRRYCDLDETVRDIVISFRKFGITPAEKLKGSKWF